MNNNINENIIIKNGEKLYVYILSIDDINTKYITKTEWNTKINISISGENIIYKDDKGDIILVYEEDENEYYEY